MFPFLLKIKLAVLLWLQLPFFSGAQQVYKRLNSGVRRLGEHKVREITAAQQVQDGEEGKDGGVESKSKEAGQKSVTLERKSNNGNETASTSETSRVPAKQNACNDAGGHATNRGAKTPTAQCDAGARHITREARCRAGALVPYSV